MTEWEEYSVFPPINTSKIETTETIESEIIQVAAPTFHSLRLAKMEKEMSRYRPTQEQINKWMKEVNFAYNHHQFFPSDVVPKGPIHMAGGVVKFDLFARGGRSSSISTLVFHGLDVWHFGPGATWIDLWYELKKRGWDKCCGMEEINIYALLATVETEKGRLRETHSTGDDKYRHINIYKNNETNGGRYIYKQFQTVSGFKEGIQSTYYENNKLKSTSHFKDGIKHGPSFVHWPNGKFKIACRYKKGGLTKYYCVYDEEGKLVSKQLFKKDIPISPVEPNDQTKN